MNPSPTEAVLRAMIGTSQTSSIEAFRDAYELAMARATRAGDHQRALELSRAYDRLPAATRDRMFPSSRRIPVGRPSPAPATRRHAQSRTVRRRPVRLLVWGVGVPAAVIAGVAIATRHQDLPTQQSPRSVVIVGGSFVVPVSAPTGANGLVTLLCRANADGPAFEMSAPRGASVGCTNEAKPIVMGRAGP